MPGAVPDNARDSAGLSIAPTGAEVTNVAGVAGFLSGSIVLRGASGKFHANRYIELTGLDQTAEGFGPGGRVWEMEPSTIWSISMEGPALVIELSTIWASTVEGSTLESRTIRDMCLYRGWLLCLHRTVRDSGLKRGGFAPAEWHLPRFWASAWMVPLWTLNLP